MTEKHREKRAINITKTVQLVSDLLKQKQKEKNWRQTGVRYSVLLELPHYDGIRGILINLTHNFFIDKENCKFFN